GQQNDPAAANPRPQRPVRQGQASVPQVSRQGPGTLAAADFSYPRAVFRDLRRCKGEDPRDAARGLLRWTEAHKNRGPTTCGARAGTSVSVEDAAPRKEPTPAGHRYAAGSKKKKGGAKKDGILSWTRLASWRRRDRRSATLLRPGSRYPE